MNKSLVCSSTFFEESINQVLIPQCRPKFLDLVALEYNLADSHRRSIFHYYGDNCWPPLIEMARLFARLIPRVQDLPNPLTFPASFVLIPLTCPLKQGHRVPESSEFVVSCCTS